VSSRAGGADAPARADGAVLPCGRRTTAAQDTRARRDRDRRDRRHSPLLDAAV